MRFLLAVCALAASNTHAQALDGSTFLETQRANPEAAIMYVRAYVDASLTAQGVARKAGAVGDAYEQLSICIPRDVTGAQTVDAVTQFIVDNPDIRSRPMRLLVGTALVTTWPCKR